MTVDIRVTSHFKKAAKKLVKKYPSLTVDLAGLEKDLRKNPKKGTPIGGECYKIRLAIKSKGKGKSGGARVITHLIARCGVDENDITRVYLVHIYDKSEFEIITDKLLKKMIAELKGEPV